MLTYKQGVDAFRIADRLSQSDRAALMGETLMRHCQINFCGGEGSTRRNR
jgi:hypothetical protein